jgi:hypothetical protein
MTIWYINTNSADDGIIGGGAAVLLTEIVGVGDLRPSSAKASAQFAVFMKNGRQIDIMFADDVPFLMAEAQHNLLVNAWQKILSAPQTEFLSIRERVGQVKDPGGLRGEVGAELGNMLAYLIHAEIPEDLTPHAVVREYVERVYQNDEPLLSAFYETLNRETENYQLLSK